MLSKIWIKNFALIQELKLDFPKGYTVITGETGSGKSILLGALHLILGDRADFSLIGKDGDKTFVEAEFQLQGLNLESWFSHNDFDFETLTLVRREINANGRSRAFINDSPASLPQLKQLSEKLVNIHSQHHTIALKDKNFHLEVLDILIGLEEKKGEFQTVFQNWKTKEKNFRDLEASLQQAEKEKDYILFQLEELEQLKLGTTDYSQLEAELNQQENMEVLSTTLAAIHSRLNDDDSVLFQLKHLVNQLDKNKLNDTKIEEFSARISSSIIDLEDVANESVDYLGQLEKNPAKILELTTFLDSYNRVLQKHKCTLQSDLLNLQAAWNLEIENADSSQAEFEKLKLEVKELENISLQKAKELHQLRVKHAPMVEDKLTVLLEELKMPKTQLKFELTEIEKPNSSGLSAVNLLFSSNAGIPLQSIEKIASGGELSRLMLSIQCLISEIKALPSIIFDEIDTGVSGEVAQKIGQVLKRMGENRQLIAISHLPQVASKASSHLKVEKFDQDGRTQSAIRLLDQEERIGEIARLMSGEKINDAALVNAQNLMQE